MAGSKAEHKRMEDTGIERQRQMIDEQIKRIRGEE